MNEEYSEYLNSEAWKTRRMKRLAIAKFRCAVCSAGKSIHVHHLTYERIYNEEMADLLPLCQHHHKIAERLVKKGLLNRRGDVLFLATETVRLIMANEPMHVPEHLKDSHKNEVQAKLLSDPWFKEQLKLSHKEFKRACKRHFKRFENFNSVMSNCLALYNRSTLKTKPNPFITERGGYTKETLASLGVPWPPKKGWMKQLKKDGKI